MDVLVLQTFSSMQGSGAETLLAGGPAHSAPLTPAKRSPYSGQKRAAHARDR